MTQSSADTSLHFKRINFAKSVLLLDERCQLLIADSENELIQAAVIQTFEFTFELGWKLLSEYLISEGVETKSYPKEIIKVAFQNGLITDVKTWLSALESRNTTSHSYDSNFARMMTIHIVHDFLPILNELNKSLPTIHD